MSERFNILLIVADQLAWKGVGAYGNRDVRTPHIDGLAEAGLRFERAYTPCPLCMPARAAFWSGRYPHQTGVTSNGRDAANATIGPEAPTLGRLVTQAGYEAVHFGKTHDAGGLGGFDVTDPSRADWPGPEAFPHNGDTFMDADTTAQAIGYLRGRQEGDRPFLLVADLQNPHNICGWVGANAGPEDQLPVPDDLPPLPDNFEIPDIEDRPRPVQYVCCAHRRQAQAAGWDERKFRQYLAAYYYYTSLTDQCVGRILEALDASGERERTVVIFLSDHGDGMAAHGLTTKHTTFYEETTRVPWIVTGPGIEGGGRVVGEPLVSLLDLLPTVSDLAGAGVPEGLPGRSLVPWLRGDAEAAGPEYVVSQWHTEWGSTVEPGRMLRTDRFKYTRYREQDGEELFDLAEDPGEMRSLVDDPAYAEVLSEHRRLLEAYAQTWGDPFFSLDWHADGRWRSHRPGPANHVGSNAPDDRFG